MMETALVVQGHLVGASPGTLGYFPNGVHSEGHVFAHEVQPPRVIDKPRLVWFNAQWKNHARAGLF